DGPRAHPGDGLQLTAMVRGRLAPTPSGHLHLGNVLAFGCAWLSARARGGELLLRVEDVDRDRARPEIEASQRDDLQWLGLHWDREVRPQRERDYAPWLAKLASAGLAYRCTCTRRSLRATGGRYPGTCRDRGLTEGAWRFRLPEGPVSFVDRRFGSRIVDPHAFGDPVLMRRDGRYAYSLAVVVDDLVDGVTEVVRGADLLDYTAVQVRLWEAFGATPPTWLHAPLVTDGEGTKLSKSHGSSEVRALRARGVTAEAVWRTVLGWVGLDDVPLADAPPRFDAKAGILGPIRLTNPGSPFPT
ncbi:MAG: tRNA glutamyl-Q(34) synthetase GluQRS, partial [Myxococcota bacterium]